MRKAFVLGAGLGTRLKPLTEVYPKPLIPVWNRPLITYAFDHLLDVGVQEFIVNTHHLPERYEELFPEHSWMGYPITFVHEPERLETGGGIANIASLVDDGPFLVYNGDILTDLPLRPLLEAHAASNNLVTLLLSPQGDNRNVSWDSTTGKVKDLRGSLGASESLPKLQFTGIYAVSPEFLSRVTVKKESVVDAWLKVIQDCDAIGGVTADEGHWWDLGTREAYLEASSQLSNLTFPSYAPNPPELRVHGRSIIDPTATIDDVSTIGSVRIGAEAGIRNSILWPGAHVAPGTVLEDCIVTGRSAPVKGPHKGADL